MPIDLAVNILAQHGGGGAGGGRSPALDLLILLAAAGLVTMLLRRFGFSTIPGYLITGAIIGKSMLGLITDDDNIASISELAILLLMFTIGLHLDLNAIRSGMVSIIAVGVGSTVAVILALWPVGLAFGSSTPTSLAVAMAFSMSSTAVVLGILQARREIHRVHGRLCVGIAVVQDLLSVIVLAVLPPLAVWAGRPPSGASTRLDEAAELSRVGHLFLSAGIAVGALALMLGFARYLLPRLLREATRGGGPGGAEELLVVSSAVALGAAVLTSVVGIGSALGAFLAGFMLASTPFRFQLAGQLSPLRNLFMAVFFTVVGLSMDVQVILDSWWIVGLGLLALLALKGVIIAAACWAGGATAPVSILTGALLSQAGEFSLVVLAAAGPQGKGIIPPETQPTLIAIVVLSLIATPMMRSLAIRLGTRLAWLPTAAWITSPALREPHERRPAPSRTPSPSSSAAPSPTESPAATPTGATADGVPSVPVDCPKHGHVIIAGFGIVGRACADRFEVGNIPFVVVELNPSTVRRQTTLGRRIVYGDISNPEVLESVGIHGADAVVLTIPDDDAVLRACHAIKAINPNVFIAARTSYLSSAFMATGVGADDVTVAEVATAESMAKQVIRRLQERHPEWAPPEAT